LSPKKPVCTLLQIVSILSYQFATVSDTKKQRHYRQHMAE
jgi:hypothetical protein